MKKCLMICAACVLMFGTAQAQWKAQQEKKFIYMTGLGYATGFGHIDLPDDDGDIFKTVYNKNRNLQVNQLLAYQFNNYFYMGIGPVAVPCTTLSIFSGVDCKYHLNA